jgi:hypothetical protein
MDRLFRTMMELCVQSAMAGARPAAPATAVGPDGSPLTPASPPTTPAPQTVLSYTGVDAMSKLLLLLVQVQDSTQMKMTMLNRVLSSITRTLVADSDFASAVLPGEEGVCTVYRFDQRPYLRIFSGVLQDMRLSDVTPEAINFNTQVLATMSNVLHLISPSRLPLFAFSWLELMSHRLLLPKLLALPAQQVQTLGVCVRVCVLVGVSAARLLTASRTRHASPAFFLTTLLAFLSLCCAGLAVRPATGRRPAEVPVPVPAPW